MCASVIKEGEGEDVIPSVCLYPSSPRGVSGVLISHVVFG